MKRLRLARSLESLTTRRNSSIQTTCSQAAKHHRAKRRLNTQRERAKCTSFSSELYATVFLRSRKNMDFKVPQRHCDSSTDTRNVRDVIHARVSIPSPRAQNMIQSFLNIKEPNRFVNPDRVQHSHLHEKREFFFCCFVLTFFCWPRLCRDCCTTACCNLFCARRFF